MKKRIALPSFYASKDLRGSTKDIVLRKHLLTKDESRHWFIVEFNRQKKKFFGYFIDMNKQESHWAYFSFSHIKGTICEDEDFKPTKFERLMRILVQKHIVK